MKREHYWMCEICAVKKGAVVPDRISTVIEDKCPYCEEKTIVTPWCDFDWPKNKRLDKAAKMGRD